MFVLKGEFSMTENEKELIKMIRENDNPKQALTTAVDIILMYLTLHESSATQAVDGLQVLA